jgi:hypothetical protein
MEPKIDLCPRSPGLQCQRCDVLPECLIAHNLPYDVVPDDSINQNLDNCKKQLTGDAGLLIFAMHRRHGVCGFSPPPRASNLVGAACVASALFKAMKMNKENFKKVLDHIEAHPETWDQATWHCGTSHCFAGWAQIMSGKEADQKTVVGDAREWLDLSSADAAWFFRGDAKLQDFRNALSEEGGYNRDGYNRAGYNRDGYDCNGYDCDGYNRFGYNRLGYNRDGYNRAGYDCAGYDRAGYDCDGLDRNNKRRPA